MLSFISIETLKCSRLNSKNTKYNRLRILSYRHIVKTIIARIFDQHGFYVNSRLKTYQITPAEAPTVSATVSKQNQLQIE